MVDGSKNNGSKNDGSKNDGSKNDSKNDLVDPVFDGVGLAGVKSRSNAFLLA